MLDREAINWALVPLGAESDRAIAKRLGIPRRIVAARRKAQGIQPYAGIQKAARTGLATRPRRRRLRINWAMQPLGRETDQAIADRIGTSANIVYRARRRLGIPSYTASRRTVDWDLQPLGFFMDKEIAVRLGVTPEIVRRERLRRGIPRAPLRVHKSSRMIERNGESRTMADWARAAGLPRSVLSSRLWAGWTLERALATPLAVKRFEYEGQRLTLGELAKRAGVRYGVMWSRLCHRGMDPATALAMPGREQIRIRIQGRTLREWTEAAGLSYDLLWNRIRRRGWSLSRALGTPAETRTQEMKSGLTAAEGEFARRSIQVLS